MTNARVPGVTCMVAEPITMVRMTDHATVAEEEYLQTLFWLQEAGLPMTGANVARAMQLSPPTVHEMIGRLERDGYITRAGDKTISFTDTGAEHAEGVVRRHRLIERFLTDVLGIPWDEVHEEAERLEHAMSPGAGGADARRHRRREDVSARPSDRGRHAHRGRPAGRRRAGRVRQGPAPGERGRGPAALLEGPGARARHPATVREDDGDEVVLDADGHEVRVLRTVAETVSVVADPAPPPRVALPEQLVLARDRYGR